MNNLDIKNFRKKYNLSQGALARILNVTPVTVARWEQGVYKIPATTIKLIELYDMEGLPAPANNNTGTGVSNKDKQIDTLLELLKEKDKQINDLTSKFLEAITILKYKEPAQTNNDYIEPLKLYQIKDITKNLFEALTIKSHIQKHNRIKTLLEELKSVIQ